MTLWDRFNPFVTPSGITAFCALNWTSAEVKHMMQHGEPFQAHAFEDAADCKAAVLVQELRSQGQNSQRGRALPTGGT
jgi:hypothetical protein